MIENKYLVIIVGVIVVLLVVVIIIALLDKKQDKTLKDELKQTAQDLNELRQAIHNGITDGGGEEFTTVFQNSDLFSKENCNKYLKKAPFKIAGLDRLVSKMKNFMNNCDSFYKIRSVQRNKSLFEEVDIFFPKLRDEFIKLGCVNTSVVVPDTSTSFYSDFFKRIKPNKDETVSKKLKDYFICPFGLCYQLTINEMEREAANYMKENRQDLISMFSNKMLFGLCRLKKAILKNREYTYDENNIPIFASIPDQYKFRKAIEDTKNDLLYIDIDTISDAKRETTEFSTDVIDSHIDFYMGNRDKAIQLEPQIFKSKFFIIYLKILKLFEDGYLFDKEFIPTFTEHEKIWFYLVYMPYFYYKYYSIVKFVNIDNRIYCDFNISNYYTYEDYNNNIPEFIQDKLNISNEEAWVKYNKKSDELRYHLLPSQTKQENQDFMCFFIKNNFPAHSIHFYGKIPLDFIASYSIQSIGRGWYNQFIDTDIDVFRNLYLSNYCKN